MTRIRRVATLTLLAATAAAVLAVTGPARAAPGAAQVVGGLAYPAMFTVAPDGRFFVSELRTGNIDVVQPADGSRTTVFTVPDLCSNVANDQGLYGLALAPGFPQPADVYAYATRRNVDGTCANQVLRISGVGSPNPQMAVLLSDPYVYAHVGGRVQFGPDGALYVSTGDGSNGAPTAAAESDQKAKAQDPSSLKGKILRLTATGGVPAGNPFGNAVWALGFRNPFGFDFDPGTGRLWATDNGPDPSYPGDPRGLGPLGGCNDEIDRVNRGANYGWGATGNCGTPPAPPLNTNRDGQNVVLPELNIEAASGITGTAFCAHCGLGPQYEGRLFYVKYSYTDGIAEIHAATLDADRLHIVADTVVYRPPGPSPLSLERGPDGTLYFSDSQSINRLVVDTSSSTAPTGLHVTSATGSSVGLAWNAVSGATEYRAYVSSKPGGGYFLYASGLTGTTATLYGLSGTWYVVVRAVVNGVESPNSNEVSTTGGSSASTTSTPTTTAPTTLPGSTAPTGLHVTSATGSTVGLAWNPVSGATEYRAYVSSTPGRGYFLFASGLTSPTATLYGLSGTWYVVVRAVVNGVESANSNEVSTTGGSSTSTTTATPTTTTPTTVTASTAPTGLHVTSTTGSTIGLAWNPVTGATEYRAYVSSTSGAGYFLYASGLTGTTATLYGLSGRWYVVLRAVVNGVESPNSNEVASG